MPAVSNVSSPCTPISPCTPRLSRLRAFLTASLVALLGALGPSTAAAAAPTVVSIVRANPTAAPTNATSVDFKVTFSQVVHGVDSTDFTLTSSGSPGGSITNVLTGDSINYTVTVSGITGDGTLRLDLNTSGTGIQNTASEDIAGGFTGGESYTFDHTPPGAPAIPNMTPGSDSGRSSTDGITNVTTPTFTGTAEANSLVDLYDSDGGTLILIGAAVAGGGGNWTITSTTLTEGPHSITAQAIDAAGNVSLASAPLAITIDTLAPSVVSVAVPAGNYATGQMLVLTVKFGEAVDVDTSGGMPDIPITLDTGGTVYATYLGGSGSAALTFGVTVLAGWRDDNGITLGASINLNGGTVKDVAGNHLAPLSLAGVASTASVRVNAPESSVAVPANSPLGLGLLILLAGAAAGTLARRR